MPLGTMMLQLRRMGMGMAKRSTAPHCSPNVQFRLFPHFLPYSGYGWQIVLGWGNCSTRGQRPHIPKSLATLVWKLNKAKFSLHSNCVPNVIYLQVTVRNSTVSNWLNPIFLLTPEGPKTIPWKLLLPCTLQPHSAVQRSKRAWPYFYC